MKKVGWTTHSMDDADISENWCCTFNINVNRKQYDIRNFFVSSKRSLHDLNDTLRCAIFVIQASNFFLIFKKPLNSHLCYFLLNIVVFSCFSSTHFFGNITLCMKSSKCDITKYVTPCLYHALR